MRMSSERVLLHADVGNCDDRYVDVVVSVRLCLHDNKTSWAVLTFNRMRMVCYCIYAPATPSSAIDRSKSTYVVVHNNGGNGVRLHLPHCHRKLSALLPHSFREWVIEELLYSAECARLALAWLAYFGL